jgi:hypothetical protein
MADECHQRGITDGYVRQLTEGGILFPLLERVRNDDTLSLEIRNGYVNIYYRGGRLLGLHARANDTKFATEFDERYFGAEAAYHLERPKPPNTTITFEADATAWVDAFATYKQAMDIRFSLHPKIEREYQQAVVRDNNRHATGELTDYVIVDIEYSQSAAAVPGQKTGYRFDMVGFRWPAKGKTRASGLVTPVIMEMKAGDGAIASNRLSDDPDDLSQGLVKHVRDFERFLAPDPGEEISKPYALLCQELQSMFETKQRLGLPSLPRNMQTLKITGVSDRPEVLFVLANHHPRSRILAQELAKLPSWEGADYRVATVEFAGYALFADKTVPLDEFITQQSMIHGIDVAKVQVADAAVP